MLTTMYYLRDSVARLSSVRKFLEKAEEDDIDIETVKSNIFGITLEMSNALAECSFGLHSPRFFHGTLSVLKMATKVIKEAKEKPQVVEAIDDMILPFDKYDYDTLSSYSYKEDFRYFYSYDEGLMDFAAIKHMAESLVVPNDRSLQVLDLRCKQGESATAFKMYKPSARLWGTGLSNRRPEDTKKLFYRTALGSLKGSNISNNVFDVMLLQPDISIDKVGDRIIIKKESELLNKSINYLRPGGVLILAMPYFRFYRDICLFLTRNFSNIQIRKYTDGTFYKSGLVYVTAVRKEDKEISEDDYTRLRYVFDIENIVSLNDQPFERVTLPQHELDVKIFRGSVLDPDEIKRIFETSPCVAQFHKTQQVEKLSENAQNPLLPFNEGQLGLVLCSGCLDGEVNEGNGYYHVVKGRVIKKIDSLNDIDTVNNEIEVVETTSNRVEINMFLPDGTHKILA